MSSTNKTTNYNLPQFIGTDKPTWLGDWNSTMNAIDTALKRNADGIEETKSITGTNTTRIDNIEESVNALQNSTESNTSTIASHTNAINGLNDDMNTVEQNVQNNTDSIVNLTTSVGELAEEKTGTITDAPYLPTLVRNSVKRKGNVVSVNLRGMRSDGYLPLYGDGYIARLPEGFRPKEELSPIGTIVTLAYDYIGTVPLYVNSDGYIKLGYGVQNHNCGQLYTYFTFLL